MSGSNGETWGDSAVVEGEVLTIVSNTSPKKERSKKASIEVINVAGEETPPTKKRGRPKKVSNGVTTETTSNKPTRKSGRRAKVSVSFAGTDKNGDTYVVLKVPKSLSLAVEEVAALVNGS